MTERYHGDTPALQSMTSRQRLEDLIARARKPETVRLLKACLSKPRRADWLAAEKAAWDDVPLSTNDALWLRSQGLAMPAAHARPEEVLDD